MTDKTKHHRGFHLTRYFSLTGLAIIVVAAAILGQIYRYYSTQHLISSEERHNAQLTQYLSAMIWPDYGAYLTALQGMDGEQILATPENWELQSFMRHQLRRTSILKVKIFDMDGLTAFSTAPEQTGADKAGYPGYERAKLGEVVSHLSFRDKFYAHADEKELRELNLLSSYVPVYGKNGKIEGVLELYNDITSLTNEIHNSSLQLMLATVGVMLCLYFALYFIIRRADRIIQDKSRQQQENERKIQHQANHDNLTSLPNRRRFRELLADSMTKAEQEHTLIALLFIDLDRFKPINDTLGHQVGDELLKIVAQRLVKCCRDYDIVARLGGDEFTVIIRDLETVECVERCAQRIIDSLGEPIYLADKELTVGASIGITIYPFDDIDIDELIKHADTAMYHAKESGRNCFHFYSEEMNAEAHNRLEMERDLRKALKEQEFELYYQPRFDLTSEHVTGVEALIRWNHPERGMVSPLEFIPLAEDTGLINPIGHWVLRTACQEIAGLAIPGNKGLAVSVNVSARQFEQDSFIEELQQVLNQSGLSPQLLELELTESMLMRICDDCSNSLENVKRTGVKLSLDDFGTGYSSLNYIKRLPLDTLKIDRSFICDVTENPKDAALAASISNLAHNLEMKVVAEGVETQAQLDFVKQHRCHEVQGYLISKPLPLTELRAFLQQSAEHKKAS